MKCRKPNVLPEVSTSVLDRRTPRYVSNAHFLCAFNIVTSLQSDIQMSVSKDTHSKLKSKMLNIGFHLHYHQQPGEGVLTINIVGYFGSFRGYLCVWLSLPLESVKELGSWETKGSTSKVGCWWQRNLALSPGQSCNQEHCGQMWSLPWVLLTNNLGWFWAHLGVLYHLVLHQAWTARSPCLHLLF